MFTLFLLYNSARKFPETSAIFSSFLGFSRESFRNVDVTVGKVAICVKSRSNRGVKTRGEGQRPGILTRRARETTLAYRVQQKQPEEN